jgi:ferredoxin/flavodoxin
MKTTIYYFSGTGNSLKIARNLAVKLKDTELIPIAKIWQEESILPHSSKIGFIFPLYFYGCPLIILDFLKKLELSNIDYIFAVITSHGGGSGATLSQINKILGKDSKYLNAGFSIQMPGNYIPMYDIASKQAHNLDFERAKDKINFIADVIGKNGKEIQKEILPVIGKLFNSFFCNRVNKTDKNYYADERCNSCEVCEAVCPVNNIIMIDGRPVWQQKCQRCLACIHFCPQKAIQYGKKTIKRKRYHHPEITINDIINQN